MLGLEFGEGGVFARSEVDFFALGSAARALALRQVLGLDLLAPGQDGRALDGVAELAQIAGPRIGFEAGKGGF
jgi:hypothetical protein